MPSAYRAWRRIHLGAAFVLCLVATAHVALTIPLYRAWSPDAVWFMGAGLGLLLLGLLNWTHVGMEPCQQPTAHFVRWANWSFAVFGIAALVAVPMPQAYVIVAALTAQAIAAHQTLPGPGAS
jgi:hypothetical protein